MTGTVRAPPVALGARPTRMLVVGCEPQVILTGEDYDDMLMELSGPVRAAVDEAVKLVESLVEEPGGEIESEDQPDLSTKRG